MRPFHKNQGSLTQSALDVPTLLSERYWAELYIFLAVAKTKSFRQASEITGESVPTISRRVKRLQDQLKTRLVHSTPQGTILTEVGERLAIRLAELDFQLHSIANNIHLSKRDPEGIVRIAATEGLAGVFLATALAELSKKYPKLQVHLRTPINVNELQSNQTEIMIGFSNEANQNVSVNALGHLHFTTLASQQYIQNNGIPCENDIENHKFVDSIFYQAKTDLWRRWQGFVERGSIAASCDSSLAYGVAVRSGLGIGLLGTYLLADPAFVEVDLGISVSVPMFALALKDRLSDPTVRVVYDWLPTILGPDVPWFAYDASLRPSDERLGPVLDGLFGKH